MNYGELKSQLANLGFSDLEEVQEFGEVIPQSVNRATTEINMTIAPILGTYEIEQDGKGEGYNAYNMSELTKDGDTIKFIDFEETPILVSDGKFKKFNDYELKGETIHINAEIEGRIRVYYKKAHTPFEIGSLDTQEVELPLKAHILLPLLTAYYVWLEDEKPKAVDYYNQYEKLSQSIKSEKVRMRILKGGL